ncbi:MULTISPECIES: hypothetical protein [Pseudomonas aeruginosa group]|uniref:hypothetical protein n=1 Tax=Pseudomonas aeruginosa group TaxID=136841 RepID=UPI0028B0A264|nr:hypothetical protein [Pseudomonas nitroreducens]
MKRNVIDRNGFNPNIELPYDLRLIDFEHAMQDVYDFFGDVNNTLAGKGLRRMDDMARPAMMSGLISDMITATLANSSRTLVENTYFNGHPDLVKRGVYVNDSVKSGTEGVEVKSTRKKGGAVDTHGARAQWMCVFVYEIDNETQPVSERFPMQFTEVYLSYVTVDDFRKNERGELGTRTATLHAEGVKKLREGWVYKAPPRGLVAKR